MAPMNIGMSVPTMTPMVVMAPTTPRSLDRLRAIDPASLPLVSSPGRMAPPWSGMGKFICVGLNYADHAAESGMPVPAAGASAAVVPVVTCRRLSTGLAAVPVKFTPSVMPTVVVAVCQRITY